MKTVSTDPLYQKTFLPKIASAETQIKKLIVYYFLHFKPKNELRAKISEIISNLSKSLPSNVLNKQAYINGLIEHSEKMIREYYDKAIALFLANVSMVKTAIYNSGNRVPFINNPIELQQITKKYPLSMWEQAKGTSNYIPNYSTQVKRFIKEVADETITAEDGTSKGISIWQKAELDIRHERQMKMLNDLIDNGVEYAYISSHPDCSKRCEKWQGKLVSLTKHSTISGFRVEKFDGQWVYSLPEIIAQVDKYGYQNNIIVGFNCRHRLIEYTGQLPPNEYSKKDIKKQRHIEAQIKAREREIRKLKNELKTMKLDPTKKILARELEAKIKKLTSDYYAFCEKHGYAAEEYRL